ncbi:hypothetical protein [Nonomuraea fuscirosea]|uniref:hypothetical protein n=1 Tax=Nonomuraea fuscirosea TaxID=1291556 RepID=UPI003400773E
MTDEADAELRAVYGNATGLEALYGALTDDRLGDDGRAVPAGLTQPGREEAPSPSAKE